MLNSSAENRAIIGNLVREPVTTSPEDQKINLAINKSSINQFQNTIELNKMEIKEIRKKVYEKLKNEKDKGNWKFVISHKDLYNELESQIRNDLENNPYEMIITGQTIITSKYFDEYGKIKNQITPEKAIEGYFYHGSRLINHLKIAKEHFLMPGQDKITMEKEFMPLIMCFMHHIMEMDPKL